MRRPSRRYWLDARRAALPFALSLAAIVGCTRAPPPASYPVARIQTRLGEILLYLYPETPHHRASFIKLASSHYWDAFTFNRVIPDFVAQGGCPDTPAGFADSPYLLEPEFDHSLRHVYGAVGAGRDDNPKMLSAGCQFYIVANKNGLARLDDKYTVYGRVIKGMDVVEAVVSEKTDGTHNPVVAIGLHVDVIEMTADQLRQLGFMPDAGAP